MPFKMPPIVGVVAIVCAGVGLLFQIIGVATNSWQAANNSNTGLWEYCIEDFCFDISSPADWVEACRAFGILGVLVLAGAVVLGVLMCFTENTMVPIIAAILGFVAGVLILIEFAVYAGESTGEDLGYSFALTIVACVFAIVCGVCFFLSKKSA